MKMKKLIVAGGTGFLGQAILKRFAAETTQIIVLSRGSQRKEGNVSYLQWDGKTLGSWTKELEGADVLINLTGKSVDCRYNEKNKAEIISSRVNATRVLGEAMKAIAHPPTLWMNAASATIYRASMDKAMDEYHGETGSGFSVEVCKLWEQSFNDAEIPGTRKIALRISMVLGREGGVMPVMTKLVKRGLGGKMGSGEQFISWIHEEDFLNAIEWMIRNKNASGPYNLAAPDPVTNKQFMTLMRKFLSMPFGLPSPGWLLEIGAFFLRTETELVLKSRKVIPRRLMDEGFKFNFAKTEKALKDLLHN